MIALAVLLILVSTVMFFVGIFALLRPLRRIGLDKRWKAGVAVVLSCVLSTFGGAMIPASSEPVGVTANPPKALGPASATKATPSPNLVSSPAAVVETKVPLDVFSEAERQQHAQLLDVIADGRPAFNGLPNPQLMACSLAADPEVCSYEQWTFLENWAGAHAGDYGDQRNVAFCLTQGCQGVMTNAVQGCAWRSVIIASADPEMGDGDVRNFETDCGRLSQAARVAADGQARRITALIAERS